ncbi:MAG: hypothetical protein AAF488_00300 [Planctomycetota bacterium]
MRFGHEGGFGGLDTRTVLTALTYGLFWTAAYFCFRSGKREWAAALFFGPIALHVGLTSLLPRRLRTERSASGPSEGEGTDAP